MLKVPPIDFATLAILHLVAAGLSLVAMMDQGRTFYALTRPAMFAIGVMTGVQSWTAAEPAWVPVFFIAAGGMSFVPLGALWSLANPLVALAYAIHVIWLALHTLGWL